MNVPILIVNISLAILVAPLIDGLRRKITARLQNRIGPPITQSWRDLVKLFHKETILPEGGGVLLQIVPALMFILSISMFATISTVTPQSPLEEGGVIFIELAVLSAFVFAVAGSMSRNPYGVVGGSREVILATLVEPSIIVSLTSLILFKGSTTLDDSSRGVTLGVFLAMAALAYLLSLLAESGRVPFDVAEAESELSGGALMEFSGAPLATLKFSQYVRSLALFSVFKFFISPLIPFDVTGMGFSVAVLVVYIISLLLCTLLVSLAESLNARYKLLEASRFYAFVLIFASLVLALSFLFPGLR
jgi:formate hydrogenlyase subunit 4